MYTNRRFEFNFLASKSKLLSKNNKKKNETTFYSFLLVLSSLIIFLLLFLTELILITTKKNQNERTLKKINNDIATYEDSQIAFGKLVSKASLLEPILEQDIQLQTFLDIVQEIIPANVEVVSYKREKASNKTNGKDTFLVEIISDTHDLSLKTLTNALIKKESEDNTEKKIENVYIENLSKSGNRIKTSLRLIILNE